MNLLHMLTMPSRFSPSFQIDFKKNNDVDCEQGWVTTKMFPDLKIDVNTRSADGKMCAIVSDLDFDFLKVFLGKSHVQEKFSFPRKLKILM